MSKILKRFLSLVLCLGMLLSVTACGNKAEVSGPITLTDQAGRTVTLQKYPEKIVSAYYISTSTVISLGLKDKLVGIEAKAKTRPIYSLCDPNLISLPNTGTAKSFDIEACVKAEPELVILPIKLKEQAKTLESLGITTLLVNPETEETQLEMISIIAEATGTQKRGKEIIDYISKTKSSIDKKISKSKNTSIPSVYLTSNSSYLSTCGEKMFQSTLISFAHGTNVAKEITDNYWANVSYEQILAWNPEYIILASDASFSEKDVYNDPALADCLAVKNKNVYKIPGNVESWDSPLPGSIIGTVWLSSILHPDVISSTEYDTIAKEFYSKFYNVKL